MPELHCWPIFFSGGSYCLHDMHQLLCWPVLLSQCFKSMHQLHCWQLWLICGSHHLHYMSSWLLFCVIWCFTVQCSVHSRLLCCSRSICVHHLSSGHSLQRHWHCHTSAVSSGRILPHPHPGTHCMPSGLLLPQHWALSPPAVWLLCSPTDCHCLWLPWPGQRH